jgi:putative transposase
VKTKKKYPKSFIFETKTLKTTMKKEFYRRKLPHYNTPGQEYYVTIILDSSVPKNSMKQNKLDIEIAKNNLDIAIRQKESDDVIQNYTNILKEFKTAYSRKIEKILHNQNNPEVDLSISFNMKPIISTLQF